MARLCVHFKLSINDNLLFREILGSCTTHCGRDVTLWLGWFATCGVLFY